MKRKDLTKKLVGDPLWKNAVEAGLYETNAFIAHDKKDYEKTRKEFYKALKRTMPWQSKNSRVLKQAARKKVEVLRYHDIVEEDANLSREQKLTSPIWKEKVLPLAREEARLLGINEKYAEHKVNFYRLHGQGDPNYKDHVMEMEGFFGEGVTGSKDVSQITGPLYLMCIKFHDRRRALGTEEHDQHDKDMMQLNYASYVYNLHKAMPDCKTKVLGNLKPNNKA